MRTSPSVGLGVALGHQVGEAGVGSEGPRGGDGRRPGAPRPTPAPARRCGRPARPGTGTAARPRRGRRRGGGRGRAHRQRRAGHGDEGRLDVAQPPAVAQQAGELDEVGAGVGVGRSRARPARRSRRLAAHRLPGPVLGDVEDGGVDAEVAGEPEPHAGVAAPGPAQHGRAVVLEVAGAEQDVGHGHDVGRAGGDQVVDARRRSGGRPAPGTRRPPAGREAAPPPGRAAWRTRRPPSGSRLPWPISRRSAVMPERRLPGRRRASAAAGTRARAGTRASGPRRGRGSASPPVGRSARGRRPGRAPQRRRPAAAGPTVRSLRTNSDPRARVPVVTAASRPPAPVRTATARRRRARSARRTPSCRAATATRWQNQAGAREAAAGRRTISGTDVEAARALTATMPIVALASMASPARSPGSDSVSPATLDVRRRARPVRRSRPGPRAAGRA